MRTTKDLNVTFLGIIPVLEDKTGILSPQEIVSLSSLLVFKGKSVQQLYKDGMEKGMDREKRMQRIMRKSSLRGHASIATTPVICFSYEGSKFLDSGLTSMTFASALMASGRRTDTSTEDIVYPSSILSKKGAKEVYRQASGKNINLLNFLLSQGVSKDAASKVLQFGVYGTGVFQFPMESIVALKREWETEGDWMPEEVGFLLKKIEGQLKNYGVDLLYATRQVAPRNTYPYPNIFKNHKNPNIVRDLMSKKKTNNDSEIVSTDFLPTSGLKKRLEELEKEIKKMAGSKKDIKKCWHSVLLKRNQIARDYHLAANIKILSTVVLRVWGEKKRHRTVSMVVESIYYCVDRAAKIFKKYEKQIQQKKLDKKAIDRLGQVYSIPQSVAANEEFLYAWLERGLDSLNAYNQMTKLGVKPPDALFVVPRALKVDVLQEYNLFNLISGYYPIRICSTAEEEMRSLSRKEVAMIKNLLKEKGLGYLASHLVPKCQAVGFCLEETPCGMVQALVEGYDDKFHQEMHGDLEDRFQEKLKEIQ
ncbi:MAG: FAD-dependent thymidylate synthase [Candidatus Portnoybacteria bacterium]|nr:FAD-dependent thymidylate synthase [Candidatus Portnoybacteria bacterium]